MRIGLFIAFCLGSFPCFAETSAGFADLTDLSEAERPLALSIWYPSEGHATTAIGGNAVFLGEPAVPAAPLPTEPLPLIVVSHGGLRSAADSGAWLSSSIAKAGFIVAEINAPRPESASIAVNEVWRRPQDISRAVDRILSDANWGKLIDQDSISAVGFALGATAALSVAGAKLDVNHYMRSCDIEAPFSGPDCGWYASQGVTLTQTNQDGLAGLRHDPRITSAVAIEPEYLAVLDIALSDTKHLLVSLGNGDEIPNMASNISSVEVADSSAIDAFAACTDAGPSILEEDGDASICGPSKERREGIHQRVTKIVTSFLSGEDK